MYSKPQRKSKMARYSFSKLNAVVRVVLVLVTVASTTSASKLSVGEEYQILPTADTLREEHQIPTDTFSNSMKVFGLGPGKTGTISLRLALMRLGFGPSYHMAELLFEPSGISTLDDMELWRKAALGIEPVKNLKAILEPWMSGCDWPLMAFPRELLEIYPDAKFILTVRPTEQWYSSISKSICLNGNFAGKRNAYMPIVRQIPLFPYNRFKTQWHMMNAVSKMVFDGNDMEYLCDPVNSKETMQWYEDWQNQVVDIIPKDQLLLFQTGKDGYKELANFLNVPVPDEPYPSSNDSKSMRAMHMKLRNAALTAIAILFILIGAILFVTYRLMKKISSVQQEKRKSD